MCSDISTAMRFSVNMNELGDFLSCSSLGLVHDCGFRNND
jgi:hypothetical protein